MTLVQRGPGEATRLAGPAVLLGHLPEDAQPTWSFKTRTAMRPNTTAMAKAGLSLDMLVWPLRRRGISALWTGAVRVGRAPSNEVPIPHIDVSKLHARINLENGKATVVDAGSANGTLLNGTRVGANPPRPLVHGDTLQFGPITLRYMETEALLALLRSEKPPR